MLIRPNPWIAACLDLSGRRAENPLSPEPIGSLRPGLIAVTRGIELIGPIFYVGGMGRLKRFDRQSVIDKALPLFWRQGFARTSLSDLERATGVNKSGLYAEFKDKEDLYIACLNYHCDTPSYIPRLTKEPLGWDNIQGFLETMPGSSKGRLGCFAVNSLREVADLPAEVGQTVISNYNSIGSLIRPNVEAECPGHEVDAIVEMICVFFWGICIHCNLADRDADRRRAVAGFVAMLRATNQSVGKKQHGSSRNRSKR
jgi:TetR/AcrR family transcriptional regulator, copper-responsive repressor